MFKAAWRGVRSRGWSGVFVIALLAVALACNAVMFAFADSLVFSRDPFRHADRIVALNHGVSRPERMDLAASNAAMAAWSRQTDVFAAVGAAHNKTIFLKGEGAIEEVRAQDVTVGFFDVLGVAPRWGRKFAAGDETDPGVFAVIISEDLARRRFGHPGRAPGQRLEATAGPLVVVGVMDRDFIYPNSRYHIWRALDPIGPLTNGLGGLAIHARVNATVPLDRLSELLKERSAVIGASIGLSTYSAQTRNLFSTASAARSPMMLVLLGAAISLLLATCANVASLELAGAVRRARSYAVQRSLGASPWQLAAQAAIEGAILVLLAFALAIGLALLLTDAFTPILPEALRLRSHNPVDLDARGFVVMSALAAITWIVAALPAVLAASRSNLMSLLKVEDRSAGASRASAWLRRGLSAAQVAFAVVLVTGGVLYARSYQNLLAVEKGFDSGNLFLVSWIMPPDFADNKLGERALSRFRETPGIAAATASSPPPSVGDSPSLIALEIDGRPPASKPIAMGRKWVDYDYFAVVTLPVKQGRLPKPGDPATDVVVPEVFARRFFPGGQAVGHTFRRSSQDEWNTIVAVVGDFRTQRTQMPEPGDGDDSFHYSFVVPPPRPAPVTATPSPTPRPVRIDAGGVTRYRSITLRTNGGLTETDLLARAREIEPRLPPTVRSVDGDYAKQSEDTRMASQIVGAFSVLAFIICMAGVFGVMAFLVAGRTREIGIRMALGADPAVVRRMVLASSARMVTLGAVLGLALAFVLSRWVQSQLFGVSSTDPATYALAAFGVVIVALFATWQPARQAARVDPAITLRAE